MISGLVILIPLYRYMGRLACSKAISASRRSISRRHPAIGLALKNAFDSVPMALEEAAADRRLWSFETFLRITLPLAVPGIASAFILNMILNWSQFLVPFIMLTEESMADLGGHLQFAGFDHRQHDPAPCGRLPCATVPAVPAFLFLQRMIVSALTAGAIKG